MYVATNNNVIEYRCQQLVELMFNMSTILLYNSLQATPPLVDTAINEPLWQCAPLHHDCLLLLFNSFFYKEQVVIHKYIIKYQQNHNQMILA